MLAKLDTIPKPITLTPDMVKIPRPKGLRLIPQYDNDAPAQPHAKPAYVWNPNWPKWKNQLYDPAYKLGKDVFVLDGLPVINRHAQIDFLQLPRNDEWMKQMRLEVFRGPMMLGDWFDPNAIAHHKHNPFPEYGPPYYEYLLMNDHPKWMPNLLRCDHPKHQPWWKPPVLDHPQPQTTTEIVEGKLGYRIEKDGVGPARNHRDGFHHHYDGPLRRYMDRHPEVGESLSNAENYHWEFFAKQGRHNDVRYACPDIDTLYQYWTPGFVEHLLDHGYEIVCYEVTGRVDICPKKLQFMYSSTEAKVFERYADKVA